MERARVSAAESPRPEGRPPGTPIPGRRTIKIQGRGAERNLYLAGYQSRHRPSEARYKRAGFKPERVAMWAVLLGILLVLVAVATAHAAMI